MGPLIHSKIITVVFHTPTQISSLSNIKYIIVYISQSITSRQNRHVVAKSKVEIDFASYFLAKFVNFHRVMASLSAWLSAR